MEHHNFNFFGDQLDVIWDGNVWVSPCNGQQHSVIGSAIRTECGAYLAACGETPRLQNIFFDTEERAKEFYEQLMIVSHAEPIVISPE